MDQVTEEKVSLLDFFDAVLVGLTEEETLKMRLILNDPMTVIEAAGGYVGYELPRYVTADPNRIQGILGPVDWLEALLDLGVFSNAYPEVNLVAFFYTKSLRDGTRGFNVFYRVIVPE